MTMTDLGELTIQTVAMPCNTNPDGDIFGGWLLSQMDLAGAILAKKIAQSRVVTVSINGMSFHHPVHVGDLVRCYSRLDSVGNTSLKIGVQAWVVDQLNGDAKQVTGGIFTFVALNNEGHPHPVKR